LTPPKAALSVNRELIALYWQIGREIGERQETQSWGTQVIDHLSADLRRAFPDMRGFSPRNLRYMRTFAAAYPEPHFWQQAAANLPWGHVMRLLDTVPNPDARAWYAQEAVAHGWSRAILTHQIEARLCIGLILCKGKSKVVAEYALRGATQPIGVSAYTLMEALPERLRGSLPTVEELEATLGDAEAGR